MIVCLEIESSNKSCSSCPSTAQHFKLKLKKSSWKAEGEKAKVLRLIYGWLWSSINCLISNVWTLAASPINSNRMIWLAFIIIYRQAGKTGFSAKLANLADRYGQPIALQRVAEPKAPRFRCSPDVIALFCLKTNAADQQPHGACQRFGHLAAMHKRPLAVQLLRNNCSVDYWSAIDRPAIATQC